MWSVEEQMGTKSKGRKMQGDAAFFEAGQRFAWWARTQRPRHTQKWLQAELEISEAKAERALAGEVSKDILERALRKWKWRIATVILEPYCGQLRYVNEMERLDRIEGELRALRAERAEDADVEVVTRVDRTLVVESSNRVDGVSQRQGREAREEVPQACTAQRRGRA
jgi:hypothetical protein